MNVNAIMIHAQIPLSAQFIDLQSNSHATLPPEWSNIHLHDFKEFVEIRPGIGPLG
jgi:hypothetical protein